MSGDGNIPMQDWAQPGEPFRLAAVEIGAADWAAQLPAPARERATAEAAQRDLQALKPLGLFAGKAARAPPAPPGRLHSRPVPAGGPCW